MRPTAAVASKPDPPANDQPTAPGIELSPEYLAAAERWKALRLEMKTMNARREALSTSIGMLSVPGPLQERTKPILDEIGENTISFVKRTPRRAQIELEEITDAILEKQPAYVAAHEDFQKAKGVEGSRIAALLRPEHAAAVRGLIAAVEQLSIAIEAERAVRRRYASASPEAVNHSLQDWSVDFADMDLTNWHSTAATWARRVRQSGPLK